MDETFDRLDHLDPASEKALRSAAPPALQRILEDSKTRGLPAPVRTLLQYLHGHLFDQGFDVATWRRKAGIRDNNVSTMFRAFFVVPMHDYYRRLRLETGLRMLAATDLDKHLIARAVGFSSYKPFRELHRTWLGRTPDEGRDRPAPWIDLNTIQRALRGELTPEELERFIAELKRLNPHVHPEPAPRDPGAAATVRRIIDGGDFERFHADRLWQRIRALPFDEQQLQVKTIGFPSTVLFDLLRRKSREEGRKDRERGVELARLALASLEGLDELFGERIHDLRALGWAYIADARRLMLDFGGAEVDLARSDEEWSKPRSMTDLRISAEIWQIKSALRMCQRRYTEALEQVDRSVRLAELEGDALLLAQALTLRASVNVYRECLRDSASDLGTAAAVIEGKNEPFLSFKINLNQANVHMRLGDRESASVTLSNAASRWEELDYPLGRHEIEHLQGNLCEMAGNLMSAEASYLEALDGFLRADEPRLAVLAALDLTVLDSRGGRCSRSLDLARWSVPILLSIKLHEETLVAIELLARELAARRIDQHTLAEVARLLRLDPLACMAQDAKAGRVSRPSCLRRL
jgi:AraC-like DNA-binding protein